jgi:hypothetical protein
MSGQHAILSPSGFKALMLCPAKPAMERGLPDSSSDYADEGTAAHFLGSECLLSGELAAALIGEYVLVTDDGAELCHTVQVAGTPGNLYRVTEEMAEAVQTYIDTVRDYQGDGELFVEQALPIGHITGEKGAEGTGDAVIVRGDEIIVIDLKYGKGVEVDADNNPQLMLYGLGALEKFSLLGDFARVRMVISQPRVRREPSEFVMDTAALVQWGEDVADPAADEAMQLLNSRSAPHLHARPHPDACRFCKAKGTCPALAESVQGAMEAEFTDLTTADATDREQVLHALIAKVPTDNLGAKMDSVELVEMWCKAIRGRVESELLAGRPVAGYKLVAGRRSARQWADPEQAEKVLKSMRLKREVMYELALISPTTAEKVLKAQAKRWKKVEPLIVQHDGRASVAPLTDKRPALDVKPVESEFTPIAETAEDLV